MIEGPEATAGNTDAPPGKGEREFADKRYRLLFERNVAGILITKPDGTILDCNEAMARIFGFESRHDMIGKSVLAYYADSADRKALLEEARQNGLRAPREVQLKRQNGTPFWALMDLAFREDPIDGLVVHGLLFDITKRKQAEEQVHFQLLLLSQVRQAVLATDQTGRVIYWNDAAEKLFGWPATDAVGKHVADAMIPVESRNAWHMMLDSARNAGHWEGDFLVKCRNGSIVTTRLTVSLWRDGRGTPAGFIAVSTDITEQKRAEEILRLHDQALRAAAGGIILTNPNLPDNPIIYANPGFEKLTGYTQSEALGRNCRFLQGPQTKQTAIAEMRRAIHEGKPCTVVVLNYRKNGQSFWNSVSIAPVREADGTISYFVGTQADVTSVKRLEEQFQQSQKMEAVGRLAGGVAHDFNNLLTVIGGYGRLLLDILAEDDPARSLVIEMTSAGDRAAALTRQLLAFSRKALVEPRVIELRDAVADAEKLLRRVIGEDIDFETVFNDADAPVHLDPGQLTQVLINLAVNARDAMPRGGKLTISVGTVEIDETYTAAQPDATVGTHVRLAVSDTGSGIPPEVLPHIWEPFFTTKGAGQGTGLGLAVVHGIVRQAQGHVRVYSEMGLGTVFTLYFPLAGEPSTASRYHPERRTMPTGNETILLAEDEEGVRSLARHVLSTCGYTVLEARDGEDAVKVAETHRGKLDLFLTDVVMPRMGGREAAEHVTAKHPGIRVLFFSGYTDDAVVRHGILTQEVAFLQKPFTPATLAQKVREVLDAGRT